MGIAFSEVLAPRERTIDAGWLVLSGLLPGFRWLRKVFTDILAVVLGLAPPLCRPTNSAAAWVSICMRPSLAAPGRAVNAAK